MCEERGLQKKKQNVVDSVFQMQGVTFTLRVSVFIETSSKRATPRNPSP